MVNTNVEQRNDICKLIAVVTMLIDHVGAVFFPSLMWIRIIGRISFPIFAYHVAIGVCHTRNIKKYLMRLFIIAVLTQPIYYALFHTGLNILFTLFYGALTIVLWENKNQNIKAVGAVLLVASVGLPILDYGYYGVFTIFLFYKLWRSFNICIVGQVILQIIAIFSMMIVPLQTCSIFALPLIYKKWDIEVHIPKCFFYLFYPIHLAIIFLFTN